MYKTNNVYLCFHKSKHFLSNTYSRIHLLCRISNKPEKEHKKYSFYTTNYHLGPPIKWWEEVGNETQRSNDMLKAPHKLVNIFSKFYSKKPMHVFYRFTHMAEASSTKNMDVCIVAENEITNSSQKRTTSALVTITKKRLRAKRVSE
jgi:hypothetical protein